jgi:hypothetical protein
LLLKLGYTDVSVTKRSGDGGVDLRATLVGGGVAKIRTSHEGSWCQASIALPNQKVAPAA